MVTRKEGSWVDMELVVELARQANELRRELAHERKEVQFAPLTKQQALEERRMALWKRRAEDRA